jgi:hypothetical protein
MFVKSGMDMNPDSLSKTTTSNIRSQESALHIPILCGYAIPSLATPDHVHEK